jgi:cellulose synthase operon protein C
MDRVFRQSLLGLALVSQLGMVARADVASDQYAVAAGHYSAERWELAAEEFQVFLTDHPANEKALHARFYRAESLAQLQKWDQAGQLFAEVLKLDGDSKFAQRALFRQAEVRLLAGDDSQAGPLLEAFWQKYPEDELNAYVLPYMGELALRADDAKAARRFYEQGMARYPKGALVDECRFGLARVHERTGETDKALEEYQALSENAFGALADKAQFQLGSLHNAAGRFAEALATFDSFLDRFKTTPLRAHAELARVWSLVKLQRYDEGAKAAAALEESLRKQPNETIAATAALLHGEALERLGQTEEALAIYSRAGEENTNRAEKAKGMYRAALAHDKLSHVQDARVLYQQLDELGKEFGDRGAMLYQWGCLEAENGHLDQAIALWKRVREEESARASRYEATYRLALAAFESRNYAECDSLLAELNGVAGAEQLRPNVLYLRGRLAIAAEKWQDAATPLTQLVAEFPEHELAVTAAYWIAESTYQQGDFANAESQFSKLHAELANRQDKLAPMTQLRRAQCLLQLHKWNEALATATQIEKAFPAFEAQHEVDYLVGRCLAHDADLSGARAAYEKVLRSPRAGKNETAAMAQWMIGETYFLQEQYANALRAYLRVEILYAFPRWQAAALLQAGKCHEELGEWTQAAELYSKVLKHYPDTEVANEATERLGIAEKKVEARRS